MATIRLINNVILVFIGWITAIIALIRSLFIMMIESRRLEKEWCKLWQQ